MSQCNIAVEAAFEGWETAYLIEQKLGGGPAKTKGDSYIHGMLTLSV